MADIDAMEMKDLLVNLGDRLNKTRGDENTLAKLKDLEKILANINTNIGKADPKTLGIMIGKSVADSIAGQLRSLQTSGSSAGTTKPNIDISSFQTSQRNLTHELELLTVAFRNTRSNLASFGNSSGGGGGHSSGSGGGGPSDLHVSNSLSKTALAASELAIVMKSIAGVGAVAVKVMLTNVDVYRQMANIGQTFGGSMTKMVDVATSGGMNLETFSKALETGSTGLRQLGGQGFADVSMRLRTSMKDFANMGMTVEQVNTSLSDYVDGLRYSGGLEQVKDIKFNQTFQNMIERTTSLSDSFGIARDQIIKTSADLRKDGDLNAALSGLPKELQDQLRDEFAAMAPEQRKFNEAAFLQSRGVANATFGVNMAANSANAGGTASAYGRLLSGQTNFSQMQLERQQAGIAGVKMAEDKGSQAYLSGQTGAAAEAMKSASYNAQLNANVGPSAAGTGLKATGGVTQATGGVDQSMHDIAALAEKTKNALIIASEKTTTAAFNNFNTLIQDNFKPLSNAIDAASGKFGLLDTAIASLITTLGPVGQGIVGAAGYVAMNALSIVGAVSGAKAVVSGAASLLGMGGGAAAIVPGGAVLAEGGLAAGAVVGGGAAAGVGGAVAGGGVAAGVGGGAVAGGAAATTTVAALTAVALPVIAAGVTAYVLPRALDSAATWAAGSSAHRAPARGSSHANQTSHNTTTIPITTPTNPTGTRAAPPPPPTPTGTQAPPPPPTPTGSRSRYTRGETHEATETEFAAIAMKYQTAQKELAAAEKASADFEKEHGAPDKRTDFDFQGDPIMKYSDPELQKQKDAISDKWSNANRSVEDSKEAGQIAIGGLTVGRGVGSDRINSLNNEAKMIKTLKSKYGYSDQQLQSLPNRGGTITTGGQTYPSTAIGLYRNTTEAALANADTSGLGANPATANGEQYGPTSPGAPATANGEQYGPPSSEATPTPGTPTLHQQRRAAAAATRAATEQYGPPVPTPLDTSAVTPAEEGTKVSDNLQTLTDLQSKQLALSTQIHSDNMARNDKLDDLFKLIESNTADTAKYIQRGGRV